MGEMMPATADRILTLTTQIVADYVGANAVDPRAVPGLIRDIQRTLTGLEPQRRVDPAEPGSSQPGSAARPAVEIRKSVFAIT
jgi:predicted transcriptional regulator